MSDTVISVTESAALSGHTIYEDEHVSATVDGGMATITARGLDGVIRSVTAPAETAHEMQIILRANLVGPAHGGIIAAANELLRGIPID